jgi:hypothetical protein
MSPSARPAAGSLSGRLGLNPYERIAEVSK